MTTDKCHLLGAEGDGGHQGDIVDGGVTLDLLCGSKGPAAPAAPLVLGFTHLKIEYYLMTWNNLLHTHLSRLPPVNMSWQISSFEEAAIIMRTPPCP